MKEVLVLHYSQSGQLTQILDNVLAPLKEDGEINVTFQSILPIHDFPFPWKEEVFYNTFPETFLQIPDPMQDLPALVFEKKYDLIVLGCQIWFLSPSRPLNSFLKTQDAQRLFKDTPVITVTGCRNMWMMAQEKIKALLHNLEAKLVGNIVLTDRHINHISVITIAHWMFSGRKDAYLGIFPKPGVSDKDIREATKFGEPIKRALLSETFDELQDRLLEKGAVRIKPFLLTIDRRANVLFSMWAKLISSKGDVNDLQRLKWVKLFKYYLLVAIWFISPIVFLVYLLTYLPLWPKIKADKAYYSSTKFVTDTVE